MGKLSAPWPAIAFVAGAFYRRPSRAAAAGLSATLAALIGFYAEQSPLADFNRGSLRFLSDPSQMYQFVVVPHRIYFVFGVATGLLFGALGSAWATRRSRRAAAAIALLFVLEPFAWVAPGLVTGRAPTQHLWWMWMPEMALGVAAILVLRGRFPTNE